MAVAIVFPGQGSQSVGMLASLSEAFPTVRATFDEASGTLGYDLWQLVQQGPEATLNQTDRTQPAMLAAGVAVWRVLNEAGIPQPALLAGHSLGEYTALVCGESVGFTDAVRLVAARGRFMQEAVPSGQGAMAAVLGLDDSAVEQACQNSAQNEVVSAVNFNSPGQVVIAGNVAAVDRAITAAQALGAKKVVKLAVSVPSHCALMRPAADRLAAMLKEVQINVPTIPVLHNVDVSVRKTPDDIREALVAQLYSPVRWSQTALEMSKRGVRDVIECGPGKVLAGLHKRNDKAVNVWPVFDPATLQSATQILKA